MWKYIQLVSLSLVKVIFVLFLAEYGAAAKAKIRKVTHKINTTECTWKIRGIRRYYGNVTINQFGDSSYNHGPHTYGVCTFTLTHPLHVNNSSPVDIVGRHSLAIESKFAIRISAPFILDWSPARNRSDMWLGGFCSHDHHMNKTNGNGPGGGGCFASAGHGGMGIDFEKDANGIKYGWSYGNDVSNIPLIGGSSGGVRARGSGFSCGGGAIKISSNTSITIESKITTNAYNFYGNGSSCLTGGSGGTIIIVANTVTLTRLPNLEARGAPGSDDTKCDSFSGSGGVIVINGTIYGGTPYPESHTSPIPKGKKSKSYGVVLINGKGKNRLQPLQSLQSLWANKEFLGCYTSSKEFNYSVLPDFKVRRLNCKIKCKACGYKYAVLHVKICVCMNSLHGMNEVNATKCSLRCFQNELTRCGGNDGKNMSYIVYDTILAPNQTNLTNSNISTPKSCKRDPIKSHCDYPKTSALPPTTMSSTRTNKVTLNTSTLLPTTTAVSTNHTVRTTLVPSTAGIPTSSTRNNKLQDLSKIPLNKDNSKTILEKLSNVTTDNDLDVNGLNLTFTILENIILGDSISGKNKTESEHIGQLVLNIADNLLNTSDLLWDAFEKEEKKSPEFLLTFVEEAATAVGESLDANDSLTLNSSNFGLRIERADPAHFHNHTFTFSGLNIIEKETNVDYIDDDEVVFIPSSLPEAMNGSGSFNLLLLKYRPHSILVNASLKNSSARSTLASNIIAISVNRALKQEFKDSVILSFPVSEISAKGAKRSCRFLDFAEKSDVSWSTRGCVSRNSEERTECLCNHFTSFAVLTEVRQVSLEKAHTDALHWLTYIGCILSLVCFIVTLTTFAVLKALVSDHIWIHCNLIASLTMAQLVFIVGIKATEYKVVCKGVAIALQYLYTAAIFWMCIEGIHLYRKVVKVFIKSSVKKHYCILGWGGPVILVLISALLRFDGFGGDKACWLSIEKGLIWAFVAPVLGVVLINVIILLLVIRIMFVAVNNLPAGENSSTRNGVKGVIFLLPILGLTWIFGVVAVNNDTIAFQYIFTIFNSFQGFFIFLFHCVFNKDVRAAIQKRRQKRAASSQRWSYDSTLKSLKDRRSSPKTNRVSRNLVNKIHVQELT